MLPPGAMTAATARTPLAGALPASAAPPIIRPIKSPAGKRSGRRRPQAKMRPASLCLSHSVAAAVLIPAANWPSAPQLTITTISAVHPASQ